MERLFFRNRPNEEQGKGMDQLHIAVTGLGRSVGTTFVATALAFYFRDMGKEVNFTQCLAPTDCSSLLFDSVAMDRRFALRSFFDVYQAIFEGQIFRGRGNEEEKISWTLPTPQNCADKLCLSDSQRARLVASAKGEVCIFDFEASYLWDEFLLDMDMVVVVADPMPSSLIRSAERFKMLKKLEFAGLKVIWMVNKTNDGVNRRQVKSYLKTNDIFWLPAFPEDLLYGDEYACRFHWQNAEIQRNLLEIFTKVSQFEAKL